MTKPVIIEYRKDTTDAFGRGYPAGARFVVTSAAKAKAVHPEATIVSFEDLSPYEEPAKEPAEETKPAARGKGGKGKGE